MPRSGFSSKVLGFSSSIAFSATGGTTVDSGGYRYHTFNSSGTFAVTGSPSKTIEVLVVAGGGGGGGDSYNSFDYVTWSGGGGGGAGQFTTASLSATPANYAVTVGGGGAGGYNGTSSSFSSTKTRRRRIHFK